MDVRVPHLLTTPKEVQADSQKARDRRSVATRALSSPVLAAQERASCSVSAGVRWHAMDTVPVQTDRHPHTHALPALTSSALCAQGCGLEQPSLQQGGTLRSCFSTFCGSSTWPKGPQQSLTARLGCRPRHGASSAHRSRSPPDPCVNVWRSWEGPCFSLRLTSKGRGSVQRRERQVRGDRPPLATVAHLRSSQEGCPRSVSFSAKRRQHRHRPQGFCGIRRNGSAKHLQGSRRSHG